MFGEHRVTLPGELHRDELVAELMVQGVEAGTGRLVALEAKALAGIW